MPLTQQQRDASECALQACERVGLYAGLNLTVTQFRTRNCTELVTASGTTCPLSPASYPTALLIFRESLRGCLKNRGYARPFLMLQLLCASNRDGGTITPWTWADWCDHLANRLV